MRSLHIGDRVLISGTIYAARDAAHKRMVETLDRGEPYPWICAIRLFIMWGPLRPSRGRPSVPPGRRPQAVWTPTRRA
ncbi:MAG: fumarate hydratase C-terminal domain-containing protein [Bilophila wadsworthia]